MDRRSFFESFAGSEITKLTGDNGYHSKRAENGQISALDKALFPKPLNVTAGLEESTSPLTLKTAAHLLRRTGFQFTQQELSAAVGKTPRQVVEAMLSPVLNDLYTPPAWISQAPAGDFQFNYNRHLELQNWWVRLMLQSPNQLLERITFFWHNHYTSEWRKVYYAQYMYWQNDLFRRNVKAVGNPYDPATITDREFFGNIKTLTKAAIRDMAMLIYLDGNLSSGGNPNENFARELLELYTLGVNNYTENDIVEASKALTGWRVEGMRSRLNNALFDQGPKTFKGRTGEYDADDITDIIFETPASARFFARKLYMHFVYQIPDDAIVSELAEDLRRNNFNLRPILLKLLCSAHFYDDQFFGAMIKSPLDLAIGSARLFGKTAINPAVVVRALNQLTLEIMNPPDVEGWKGYHLWINTSTLPVRQKYSDGVIDGRTFNNQAWAEIKPDVVAFAQSFPNASNTDSLIESLTQYLLPIEISDKQRQFLKDELTGGNYDWTVDSPNAAAGLTLMLKTMMRMPEFQLY